MRAMPARTAGAVPVFNLQSSFAVAAPVPMPPRGPTPLLIGLVLVPLLASAALAVAAAGVLTVQALRHQMFVPAPVEIVVPATELPRGSTGGVKVRLMGVAHG